MKYSQAYIAYLWQQYLEEKASREEIEELLSYLRNNPDSSYSTEVLEEYLDTFPPEPDARPGLFWEETVKDLLAKGEHRRSASGVKYDHPVSTEEHPVVAMPARSRVSIRRISYAAAVLLIVIPSVYWYLSSRNHPPGKTVATASVVDIMPGTQKATLTLADGSIVELDGAVTGQLAKQGNSTIIKDEEGGIRYQAADARTGMDQGYNVMSTPRGGQYLLVLSDGSKAWLNASSSIKYPVVFADDKREVEITGEVYLEVARNEKSPFYVTARHTKIEVLGTHFNVNAYKDEPSVQTTLVEGVVRIMNGNKKALLKPGQQAVAGTNEELTVKEDIATEAITAWKDGLFEFAGDDIKKVMMSIARWYDVEVVYEQLPSRKFYGNISRQVPVSKVLAMLEKTGGVRFKISGNKVIVR